MSKPIIINGARTNNLKNIFISIPKQQITVVTGVSGSGKSSLVFDTIAAESQRLLNETYSSYLQQLLPHYAPPLVDGIKNLPVSIVIDQKKIRGNSRSTVGTITDIYTSLRLLYSRIAKPFIGYSMVYSFNNLEGMCPQCKGIGEVTDIKVEQLIDFNKSLNKGAIIFPSFQPGGWRLTRYTETGYFDNDKKLKDYTKMEMEQLLYEERSIPKNPTDRWPKTGFYTGVIPRIMKGFIEKEDSKYQEDISRIIASSTCRECQGTRVNDKVRSALIAGKSIGDCVEMPIDDLLTFIETIDDESVAIVCADLVNRLKSLQVVGLNYLTLNRRTNTLSGGESQRIKITKHLNSALSDVLYIFDEPSAGLHPENIEGINKIIKGLKEKDNTILLVDHDPDSIRTADYVINMGEGAGALGGEVTFTGTYKELLTSDTKTARALNNKHELNKSEKKLTTFYELHEVSKNNVKDVSIKIPKGALTVVSGVAGSGKSTLISHLFREKYRDALLLDQSPLHATERSNVLTYLNVFDELRGFYARSSGRKSSLFTYNGEGGCPVCNGKGYVKLDLAYMGDIKQKCEKCNGKRYSDEALSFKWQNKNIVDILNLSIEEAQSFFTKGKIKNVIMSLLKANLGYIKLGQSLDTFSGGELQRLKIAKVLLDDERNLLILDEPTTGLHEADIAKLLELFQHLLKKGKTLIVLEHNLSIISQGDWIIDMGPGGGDRGGTIVFEGLVADMIHAKESVTGKHLNKYIRAI